MRDILIVGASAAGTSAADELISLGYDGRVTLLGNEAHPPYSRPPLSKQLLTGSATLESIFLPAVPNEVRHLNGQTAIELDIAKREVRLNGDRSVGYDGLIIATGSGARRVLPAEVRTHVVRSVDDALALAAAVSARSRVLVVGAGFLGVEVASSLCSLGAEVCLVDQSPPLSRVFGCEVSQLVSMRAEAAGVEVRTATDGVTGAAPDGTGIRLSTGEILHADIVVETVGDAPSTAWLEGSGVPIRGGVLTDARGTVGRGIVAAGDVRIQDVDGKLVRRPFWTAAINDGRLAARTLLGLSEQSGRDVPDYFWTEGFGLSIKVCGELPVRGTPTVVTGSLRSSSALLTWSDREQVTTAMAINHAVPLSRLRRMLATTPRSPQHPLNERVSS